MSANEKVLLDLVDLLYEGLVAPDAWNAFLGGLSRRVGCECAAVTFHDNENRNPSMASSIGLSPEVAGEWSAYFGNRNPRGPQVLRALSRNGSWLSANSLARVPANFRESEYVAWLHRHDLHHSLLAAVHHEGEAASLSLVRPRTAKPFGCDAVEFIRGTLPHLQRVLRIHRRNQTLSSFFEAGTMALDQLDTGVVALDANGRVVLMNEQAESILKTQRGLTVRDGRLAATNASESIRLERLVNSALSMGSGRDTEHGGPITISGGAGPGLHVIATPLRSDLGFNGTGPSAVAFLCDPSGKPASRAATLRTLFGLTPAECRLAGLLHEGVELRIAAESMSVTNATARFMLKRIFHKTGSHRQSQLIRLIGGLPGDHRGRIDGAQ